MVKFFWKVVKFFWRVVKFLGKEVKFLGTVPESLLQCLLHMEKCLQTIHQPRVASLDLHLNAK